MTTSVLEYKGLNRMEWFTVVFLTAIILSEMVVIFLLGQGAGEVLAKAFSSAEARWIGAVARAWRWIYRMVGPVLFPLMALTVIEIWAIGRLVHCWRFGVGAEQPQRLYKALGIVEGAAPGFGFLGTCISLIFTMQDMDPNMTQTAMLKSLLDNSASAFGSTVYGILLAISAFLSVELFKVFLLMEDALGRPEGHVLEKDANVESMKVIKKEG